MLLHLYTDRENWWHLQPSEIARWFYLQPTVGEEKRPQELLSEWISARITVPPYISTMRSLALQHLWHCQYIASFTFLKMREKEDSWFSQLLKSLFILKISSDDRMYVLFFCPQATFWINAPVIMMSCLDKIKKIFDSHMKTKLRKLRKTVN